MKNIFIGGVARSGKSTLAEKLCHKLRCNHLPLDYITASLKKNFPDCNISSSVIINDTSKKLSLLLSTVTNIIDSKEEMFIIDSAHIMPGDIIKYLDRDNWDIYFVGYPNANKKDKFDIIRKYDNESDWTSRKRDKELLEIIDKLIDISKKIEEECKMYDIHFIDTSENLFDVIDEEFHNIVSKENEREDKL